jgi:hypothetical protein
VFEADAYLSLMVWISHAGMVMVANYFSHLGLSAMTGVRSALVVLAEILWLYLATYDILPA